MAAERQQHRIRRGCAGNKRGESHQTKPSTEINWRYYERPESLRYASPRPRDGQQWALELPLQGVTQAGPEQTSRES
eukprot:4495866-Pleurochrysis_carterae.AAC.2